MSTLSVHIYKKRWYVKTCEEVPLRSSQAESKGVCWTLTSRVIICTQSHTSIGRFSDWWRSYSWYEASSWRFHFCCQRIKTRDETTREKRRVQQGTYSALCGECNQIRFCQTLETKCCSEPKIHDDPWSATLSERVRRLEYCCNPRYCRSNRPFDWGTPNTRRLLDDTSDR